MQPFTVIPVVWQDPTVDISVSFLPTRSCLHILPLVQVGSCSGTNLFFSCRVKGFASKHSATYVVVNPLRR